MDEKTATKLREPFKPAEVGKLPRVTCGKCSRGQCDEHSKARCEECKAWISPRHIHIDYVGHADVTSRLLQADPDWNWEPKAEDEHGLPVFDTDDRGCPVGFWIRLTVGGVTRLGYGSCPSNQYDAVKVLIGDALRNAAMRFGVALDLWAKGDRDDPSAENATASAGHAARRQSRSQSAGDAWDQATPAAPRQRGGGNGGSRSAGDAWEQAAPPAAARPEGGGQTASRQQSAPKASAQDDSVLLAWAAKIDEITDMVSAMAVREELNATNLTAGSKAGIGRAIDEKLATLGKQQQRPSRPKGPSAEERGAKPVPTGKGDDGEWVRGWMGRVAAADVPARLVTLQAEIGNAVRSKTITPAKSAELAKAITERRRELEGATA